MKKNLILATLLFVGTSAGAHNYFFGVDAINTSFTTRLLVNGQTYRVDNSKKNNFNLKLGVTREHDRFYIKTGTLSKHDFKWGNIKYRSTSLNYDYYIIKNKQYDIYVGTSLGYGKIENKEVSGDRYNGSGIDYGIKFGTIININENFNAEIGYAYTKARAKLTPVNVLEYNIDSIKVLYMGVNYKF